MSLWIAALISALSIIFDQLTKYWVTKYLKPIGNISVIKGLLDFTYVENFGAAYGSFQNKKIFLVLLTGLLILFLIYLVLSRRIETPLPMVSMALIIGGGIGNLIDRVRIGYVVDFIDIGPLFSFPVFNVADCCVVVGSALFIIYVLFFEGKEKDIKNGQ